MLRAERLVKRFDGADAAAVDRVSVTLDPGTRLGVTGPSGCGKSTLAAMLALLLAPDDGTVEVDGEVVRRFGLRAPRALRRRTQLLWQSPREAADPRMRLGSLIGEPAVLADGAAEETTRRLAPLVGLSPDLLDRFPHEVSEGELQRACIARALACEPAYLIADEPTSMLDVSSQAALLHVLADAQQASGLAILLITHDTNLARHWCTDVVAFDDLRDAL